MLKLKNLAKKNLLYIAKIFIYIQIYIYNIINLAKKDLL